MRIMWETNMKQVGNPHFFGSRTKPLSGQNPPPTKTPSGHNPPPAKTLLRQKSPSGQNSSPSKIPLRPKTPADKNSPPGERVKFGYMLS